jgi:tRNA (guanine-N7-)-methyltransferase
LNLSSPLAQLPKKLKESKHRIHLDSGIELQYHRPRDRVEPLDLTLTVERNFNLNIGSLNKADSKICLEVEIGCGKGEFLSNRAPLNPNTFFVGIDRRKDRFELTEKKVERKGASNCLILKEDARSFLSTGLPTIDCLHVYHPDPWPKERHHKHRFFRSPDAKTWALAIKPGGSLSLSTDHKGYYDEIIAIVSSWKIFDRFLIFKKTSDMGPPLTHFESIFLKKNEPVYKAVFFKPCQHFQ